MSTTNPTWPDPTSNTASAITEQWHGHVMLEDDLNNIKKFNSHLTEIPHLHNYENFYLLSFSALVEPQITV